MKLHRQRGGSLVEFAIAAPVMLLFFFAAIEFGWMMFAWHATDYAAKTGARWASVRGARCINTSAVDAQGNNVCPATANAIAYYIRSTVPGLSASASPNPVWTSPPTTWNNQPIGGCSQTNQLPGCLVVVQVSNPFNLQIPYVWNGTINLSSSAQELITGN